MGNRYPHNFSKMYHNRQPTVPGLDLERAVRSKALELDSYEDPEGSFVSLIADSGLVRQYATSVLGRNIPLEDMSRQQLIGFAGYVLKAAQNRPTLWENRHPVGVPHLAEENGFDVDVDGTVYFTIPIKKY